MVKQTMIHEYKIGKVSKITGITPDTLRIWERRYSVVEPNRTEAGGRLYSVEDVARLKLIKQLIDSGDSIGNVAALSYEQLQARFEESKDYLLDSTESEPLKMAVVGHSLPSKLDREHENLRGMEFTAGFRSLAELDSAKLSTKIDVLLVEVSTVHRDTALQLSDLIGRMNVLHTLIVYRFATSEALNLLSNNSCTAVHAPLQIATLNDICQSLSKTVKVAPSLEIDFPVESRISEKPRKFDDETLEKIASMTPVIKCECPQHLAELLSNLSAFEQYSAECENRNVEDAELHAYLYNTTAQARQLIERALVKVLEIENIKV